MSGYNDPAPYQAGTVATHNFIGDKHKINVFKTDLLNTVENVWSCLNVHEYYGHGILKYGDETKTHYRIYENQMSNSTFKNLTEDYKNNIYENYYGRYLYQENSQKYNQKITNELYEKYVKPLND